MGFGAFPLLAAKPNVLFIVADDLRAELGCLGAAHVRSPNLDRLAAGGRLFQRAYCQQAVCNPSRASFLTGLRPDTIRVYDLRENFRTAVPDAVTIPQWFKQHGYETRGIGKIFHNMGDTGDPHAWSQPPKYHQGRHSEDTVTTRRLKAGDKSKAPVTEDFDVPDEAYLDGQISRDAVAALAELKDRPFFLAVGFWRPHLPFVAPEKYWKLYDRRDTRMPATWSPPWDCPEIALHDSREIKGYGGVPAEWPFTAGFTRDLRLGYHASIAFMDAQVGKLLDALEANGLRDNTIVVFFSDHGFHLGEHGLWCKTSCFELDARVPLIIAAPQVGSRGVATDSLAELVDVFPTLTELAGLPAPPKLEGRSLVPVLKDPSATVRTAAHTQHPRPAYFRGKPEAMGVSVRTAGHRYTEWREHGTGKVLARELYDHARDPHEDRNVAGAKNQAKTVAELANQLREVFPVE